MIKIVRVLGSLAFAIFLISGLTILLIISTSLESAHGTPFAQKFFYQAGWFDVFLSLFGLNILCSTLLRFPLKKKHTGFVVTHIGLLTLLVGAFLSRWGGVDGQMMIYEGQASGQIIHNTYELIVHSPDERVSVFSLETRPARAARKLKTLKDGSQVFLHRVWEDAEEVREIKEGSGAEPFNHAVKLSLKSERVGAAQSAQLLEKDAAGSAESSDISMGPAQILLLKKSAAAADPPVAAASASSPVLRVTDKNSGAVFSVDPTHPGNEKELFFRKSGLKIENIKYYPNARVGDNFRLANISQDAQNPAVEFDVSDEKGRKAHFVKFALYPEFESMHGKAAADLFPINAALTAPVEQSKAAPKGPSLAIYYDDEGRWSYESKSSSGVSKGELAPGKTYPTGWMDFSFTVESLWNHAMLSRRVRHTLGMQRGEMAAEVSLVKDGKVLMKDWVLENSPATLEAETGKLIFVLRPKVIPVPFVLALKSFRKVDYPGTDRAASYESDVSLHDEKENLTIEKTIKMNKPLDYKGYRIFQSSYVQDAEAGNASIFTVAKNPGILFIYSGACVMFVGIFTTFFIPSLSTLKH